MEMEMIESAVEAEVPVLSAAAEALMERLTELVSTLGRLTERLEAKADVQAAEDVKRSTVPPAVATLLAKQGVSVDALPAEGGRAAALDGALQGLSLEQRIAVKSQLLRAGVLG